MALDTKLVQASEQYDEQAVDKRSDGCVYAR